MRILHIFHGSDLHNGVDQTTLTLMMALRNLGVDISAIVPHTGQVTAALDKLEINWHAMPVNCCTSFNWQAELHYLRKSGERSKFLDALFAKEHFDLVHLNTGHVFDAALAAAHAGVPVIWHIHAPFDIDYQRYARFISTVGYTWLLEALGSGVIGVSHDVSDSLTTYLSPERVRTVYNGVDSDTLRYLSTQDMSSLRTELGLPESAKLVLGVGRISAQKDFATFIRVAERILAQNPHVYFIIAGPPEDAQLLAELKNFQNTPTFKYHLFLLGKRSDVPRLMMQSDVYLSTALFEGQGLTTLEAMALGCPVVAMACVGLRECIENGRDGFLVPLGDVDAAAGAVLNLLSDENLANKLRQAGRQTVESRFSSLSYAQHFLAVARKAIEIGPSRVTPGVLELVQGLLAQITQADQIIQQTNRPQGWGERIGRKLDKLVGNTN